VNTPTAILAGAVAGLLAAVPSWAGDVIAVSTRGEAWFETCFLFGMICEPHGLQVPEVVSVGDRLERRTVNGDFGPFIVHSIRQEGSGNCFLYNSPYRDYEGIIYLGECKITSESP
jgi:hypothetical protein